MSEEQIQQALEGMNAELGQATPNEPEPDAANDGDDDQGEESQPAAAELVSDVEKEAAAQGWSKDEYEADKEGQMSAYAYNRYGKLQKSFRDEEAKSRRKENEFDQRINSLNNLHRLDMEAKIKSLKVDSRQAAEEADMPRFDEKERQIQELTQRLEKVSTPEVKPNEMDSPEILAWQQRNPWINDTSDPRSHGARGIWDSFVTQNPGGSIEQALAYVDSKMSASFAAPESTPTNPRRDRPGVTQSTVPAAKRRSKVVGMNDLTQDERDMWRDAGRSIWGGNEKLFLKSVTDSRG